MTVITSTVSVALLGPVTVGGDLTALAPRDRRVLSVLAVHPGTVCSAELIAEALWGTRPPASWHKVVPGCVLRLRRVLGTEAIETTPYGYRLTVAHDDIDTGRFERMVRRGQELLALGECERAAHTLGEALELWRGRPLPDLDGWEPGRIEAQRLIELRLDAEECRLDAALRAGRHVEMLAPAQALVAQAPLREKRWELAAIAQYRCDQQADALQTLRRAFALLVSQLGLDPSPRLVELEAAILRHDPSLTVSAAAEQAAESPYLGLVGYDVKDAESFFGREREVADCRSRLTDAGFLAVVGPSGIGKSSLVRAGVGAGMARDGFTAVVLTPGPDPMAALAGVDQVGVAIIIDQFEEVFTTCPDPRERARFCVELAERAQLCRVVIAMRADHLGDLAEHPALARLVERGLYLLGPMDSDALRVAITGPADRAGLLLESGLVDLLVREVEGEPGALPLLSHALRQTWERRDGRTLTVAGYRSTGGIRGSVARSAEQLYESSTDDQRSVLRRILLRLITTTSDGDAIRTRMPRAVLLTDPERERMVERLAAARLVTTDRESVQVAHECLARAWPRLSTWLDEDVEGQRILRHLSASAEAWQSLDRPDSELYRGVRLVQALDWRDEAGPTLTPTETQFLDAAVAAREAERRAVQERANQRAGARRRNRLVLLGVAGLVVVAMVAGLLAVRQRQQRDEADLAARVAEASRVDDAAHGTADVDGSLLLALEANQVNDSPQTRAVIADLLDQRPALIRSVVTRDVVRTLAVSPDGATLIAGESEIGSTIYRTDTFEPTHTIVNGWSIKFRPDGRQLLIAGKGAGGLAESNGVLSAAVSAPDLSGLVHLPSPGLQGYWVVAEDVAYSGDGRHFAAMGAGYSLLTYPVDTALLVGDSEAPERDPVIVGRARSLAIALSPDGTVLYALTDQPALVAFDVASGRTVASVPVPPGIMPLPTVESIQSGVGDDLSDTLELSPDGRTLALGEGNDVVLFDAATLAAGQRLRGHQGRVLAMQFSPDGRMLATGSADHTAVVWDLATGGPKERLTGHSGAVLAVAFAPDGNTLYTGAADRHVLVWDLGGQRRFLTRTSIDGDTVAAAVPSPDGTTVAVAGGPSGSALRLVDLTAGRRYAETALPAGDPLVAWIPGQDRTVAVAAGAFLQVWDPGGGRSRVDWTVQPADITALATRADGGLLVGDASGVVDSLDGRSLQQVGRQVRLGHPITALAAVPDGRVVAFLNDMTYQVVDPGDGMVKLPKDLGITVVAAAMSPDGARLVVGGSHGEVGQLDLDSGQWLAPPAAAHRQFVTSVSFSADGGTVSTSSFDGEVRIWDVATGEPIVGARVDESAAMATLIPGEHAAVVVTRHGHEYRIATDFGSWASFACQLAGRNLTADEWRAVFGQRPRHDTCSS